MARAEDHIRELLKLPPAEREHAAKVLLESLDGPSLPAAELSEAWAAWIEQGPQGPIEDEDEAAWP